MSRRHNNANVLCLAANGPMDSDYRAIIDTWLATDFEGGRHERRVAMMR
jgi:ribose 5-phosphate isomerase RpiB